MRVSSLKILLGALGVILVCSRPALSRPLDVRSLASGIGAAASTAGPGTISPSKTTTISPEWGGPLRESMSRKISAGLVSLADGTTHVAPSHTGQPGLQDAAFVYDKAVDALVLHAAQDDQEAHAVLDYFAQRLRISLSDVKKNADANGIYGMLKLVPSIDDPRGIGLVNAVDCRSTDIEGRGQVEYWTTPGPVAFMVMAFLKVDRNKYLPQALTLGRALLLMQRADGAVTDGDRGAGNVWTEPHMDSYSAFLMLFEATKDKVWKDAADKAWGWFTANVYRPAEGAIFQGMRPDGPTHVFATDAYSWTMAGRGGERLPLDVLERLTDRMLRRTIAQVTLELPDGKTRTVTLVDFTDPEDERIKADRGGFHPMGSVEWIGGVILALQKNAVRFWDDGSPAAREKAGYYKALAEFFSRQALDTFYVLDGVNGLVSFYATSQWMATGHGWKTPYFYVKDPAGKPAVKGGSTIGAWVVLPLLRDDPFKLDDDYGPAYDAIPLDEAAIRKAGAYITEIVQARTYTERVPTEMASDVGDVPEMWRYNVQMFNAFNAGNYYAAILWAEKVVSNSDWRKLAVDQQRRKERDIKGLVDYTWGTPVADAKERQRAIQKYPLLNEMGTAMWGMAVAQYKLGNRSESKNWVRTIIETVPYHQIFAPAGPGYWNALVSWETNPGGSAVDAAMGEVYREVLHDMGRASAMPNAY